MGQPRTDLRWASRPSRWRIDRRYPTGDKKRSSVLTFFVGGLERIFSRQPLGGPAGRRDASAA